MVIFCLEDRNRKEEDESQSVGERHGELSHQYLPQALLPPFSEALLQNINSALVPAFVVVDLLDGRDQIKLFSPNF